jgi:hypothetical protein
VGLCRLTRASLGTLHDGALAAVVAARFGFVGTKRAK